MGWVRIARAAHCSTCTISRLLDGQELMRRSAAERILSVKFRPAPGRTVDATGTRRRVQALMAIGHTITGIATESDVDYSVIVDILNGCTNVRGATADRIAAAYDWLAHRPPTTDRKSAATASRNRAAREGWRDPLWWEDMGDIDDPAFDANTADAAPTFRERAALRREEIIHLAWSGHEPSHIRERLNDEVSISTVQAIVREWQTGKKRDRKAAA
ncbi:hypothetical protein [Streptomyces noursei]|uniref:hypothetical protein n=1 Tax=Streptomyces noursei TaxID=1971 RepID=UPI0035D558B1